MKVQIVVTHLLGTGHLSRALTLGRAFVAAGHQTQVVSGGMAAPQLRTQPVEFLQLPPIRSDGVDFSRLLTHQGQIADATFHADRQRALLQAFDAFAPDVLITELFPFGRRSLRHEFRALLARAKAARQSPVILASIRDILAPPSKPEKATQAAALIQEYYDAVLVHSDPDTTRLDISWPVDDALSARLRYTGYVAPPPPASHPTGAGADEVLVSAGGGSVGDTVYHCALEAARLRPDQTWRVLVGGTDSAARITRFQTRGSPAIVEPARPDFRQMLQGARASISLCGYNTALDVLQTGVPAVFVPFDAGREVEQTLRAQALSQLNGIEILRNAALTPNALLAAVDRICAAPKRPLGTAGFNGAAKAVTIAAQLAAAKKAAR